MDIRIPTDSDGFLAQECRSCQQRFKVRMGEGSDQPVSCCPYCGFRSRQSWVSADVLEYAKQVALAELIGPQLQNAARKINAARTGLVKLSAQVKVPSPGRPPIEVDEQMPFVHFRCCNERVRLYRRDRHFCVICGTEVSMAASAATKIFLSHKGLDKPRVREFKQTLQQLGYQPWLDEDALKAGDHLERGLLQGMEESCAAVFFITPAFKDEGYLATEVDYAVQQLRAKGKRFAIIALSFCDEAGNEGQVPKLLQSYVWKHPKHDLEAIREIVRAVPLALGEVRWAAGIEGVADLPVAVSTVGELTPEAKAILLAAAEANGRVYHPKLLNADILQAGDKEMLPDQSPRTVAAWRAGLEELRRRGYVKDVGHKGEMFEVVDLGYKAADVLAQSQSE